MDEFFDKLTREEKLTLVQTCRDATEGKFFAEVEYAKCTWIFAEMKEEDGLMKEAAEAVLEVQVETYGSMKKEEKLDYILYQMWIVLDMEDYVRTQIISKKVNRKNLNDEGFEELKVRYYELAIKYYIHEKEYLESAKSFQIIYDTIVSDKENKYNFSQDQKVSSFTNFICFLLFSPYNNETVDLLNHVIKSYRRELSDHPILEKYVWKFLVNELIPLEEDKKKAELGDFFPFQSSTENSQHHITSFFKRII